MWGLSQLANPLTGVMLMVRFQAGLHVTCFAVVAGFKAECFYCSVALGCAASDTHNDIGLWVD